MVLGRTRGIWSVPAPHHKEEIAATTIENRSNSLGVQ